MRLFPYIWGILLFGGCAPEEVRKTVTAPAQIGIVNHTKNFIYAATVDGYGGGPMDKWGAGHANICCASIPRVWDSGFRVLVRWDMPKGHTHIVKEKMVSVEKYEEPGDIYMHFYPNDEVRVVVSNIAGYGKDHPIAPPKSPITDDPTEKVHD